MTDTFDLKIETMRLLKSAKSIDCAALEQFFAEIGPARAFNWRKDDEFQRAGIHVFVRLITPWKGKEMMDRFKPWFDAKPWPFIGSVEISVGETRKITPHAFYCTNNHLRNSVECFVVYDGITRKTDWKSNDVLFGGDYSFEDGIVWHYQDPAWIEKWRVIDERNNARRMARMAERL